MKAIKILTAILLAAAFLLAGLAVCVVPPATTLLAHLTISDAASPFTKTQLVEVAQATRDYSFGDHDLEKLYQTIYQVNREYAGIMASQGKTPESGFPSAVAQLDIQPGASAQSGAVAASGSAVGRTSGAATSASSAAAASSQASASAAATTSTTTAGAASMISLYENAFAGASERFVFSRETISHLDDCHNLFAGAVPLAIVIAALALIGLIVVRVKSGKRSTGNVLLGAGIGLIVVLIGLGVWAFLDFRGFFGVLHSLFFSAGTWTFPYDSLLICALPTAFWIGMGIVVLAVALLLSILSIFIGVKLHKAHK